LSLLLVAACPAAAEVKTDGGAAVGGGDPPGDQSKVDTIKFFLLMQQYERQKGGALTQDQFNQIANLPQFSNIDKDAVHALWEKYSKQNGAGAPSSGAGVASPLGSDGGGPAANADPNAAAAPVPAETAARAQKAELAFDNAWIAQKPGDYGLRAQRGVDFASMGQFKQAYGDLNAAIAHGVATPQALDAYSQSAYQLGDYALASSVAQRVLSTNPNDPMATAIYHMAKDRVPAVHLPSAFGDLTAAPGSADVAGQPEGPLSFAAGAGGAAIAVGGAARPSGMTAEQLAQFQRQAQAGGADALVRSKQFSRDAANALGLGDPAAAYQLASQSVQLNPSNAQALNFRAIALNRLGRDAEAVQDASAALALAPDSAAALQTRSLSYARLGQYREALQDADATLASSPTNAFAWQNKAFALAGLGDRAGALDALRRSAAADPRFQGQLERALQLPQDADLKLLFQSAPSSSSVRVPSPAQRNGRFLRLMILTAIGGLLIALGTLHVVSSTWREGVRNTIRRVTGGGSPVTAGAASQGSPGTGAFWTQYNLVKEIGLGGMGVVYEAVDRSLERRVAVKRMRDEIRMDPRDRQRFVNEARLVAQLHHPNIVDIYGIVEDGADVYLVFEFVAGRTLSDFLKDGPLEFSNARRVLREMAAAVEHAHGRGVIHRDLKPSNVMLTPEGRVKVMDFGIARQAKDAMTRRSAASTNTIAGTPPYMAPEQEQGTVRKESDVYALGVCFYEMLTGQLPFGGIGGGMLLNKLNNKLTPARARVPTLPAGVDEVLAKALSADPEKRYRTPTEFADALDAVGVVRAA